MPIDFVRCGHDCVEVRRKPFPPIDASERSGRPPITSKLQVVRSSCGQVRRSSRDDRFSIEHTVYIHTHHVSPLSTPADQPAPVKHVPYCHYGRNRSRVQRAQAVPLRSAADTSARTLVSLVISALFSLFVVARRGSACEGSTTPVGLAQTHWQVSTRLRPQSESVHAVPAALPVDSSAGQTRVSTAHRQ